MHPVVIRLVYSFTYLGNFFLVSSALFLQQTTCTFLSSCHVILHKMASIVMRSPISKLLTIYTFVVVAFCVKSKPITLIIKQVPVWYITCYPICFQGFERIPATETSICYNLQ